MTEYIIKLPLWEMVALKHDPDKLPRMITAVRIGATTLYCLSCGDKETWHYEQEIDVAGSNKTAAGFKIRTAQ